MKITYGQRRERCHKFFWMSGSWTVVVKCKECTRFQEATVSDVMDLDGILKFSFCGSCNKYTCEPMSNDNVTVAHVL